LPGITSPQATVEYHARVDSDGTDVVTFNATADGEVSSLHWFVDNRYIGVSQPGVPLAWKPQPGRFSVRVVDDRGRSDTTRLFVALVQ